ncbi:sterol regulatory element-binding protein cleavage-activating protein-like [Tubulanus polymorphus]|uniref:sterol regulatory element-binding protein cleavage-activating protein-like n=1 Tax=Tubulanus polymorphus TaxID=672921 RepID=UPI003DA2B985
MKKFREKIAQLYYTHGLICASHPYSIITWVLVVVFIACYPLRYLPLPGNAPLQYKTPVTGYKIPQPPTVPPRVDADVSNLDETGQPLWYVHAPLSYIQQIEFKMAVSPWHPYDLIPTDAFRAPLMKVFDIVNAVNEVQFVANGSVDGKMLGISDLCFRVEETLPESGVKDVLPEYDCLIVSPAGLWQRNRQTFQFDGEILKTISRAVWTSLNSCPLLKDVVFGVPWKNTGVPRYFLRNRQRIINFAVTLVLKTYDPRFQEALREKLTADGVYSLESVDNKTADDDIVHVYYKDINYFVEYTLLLVTYLVLFLYIYFSVRKIEMVKSKWGLALSAVATVVASLLMSISVCTFFGLQPSLLGSEIFEIFPYLIVIIGLENILVLTKSVVSTPVHLDVKYRIAQGLSREGWSITKNILIELLILLFGFFTFVPAIQEFVLFACVGLLSDFFLQMVFFVTVLSIDIRRMELSDLHKKGVTLPEADSPHPQPFIQHCPVMSCLEGHQQQQTGGMKRVKSHPSLTTSSAAGGATLVEEKDHRSRRVSQTANNVPKRLRLIYFLASTRVAQRMLMICTIVWIGLILYNTGLVDQVIQVTFNRSSYLYDYAPDNIDIYNNKDSSSSSSATASKASDSHVSKSFLAPDSLQSWKKLSYAHWPTLFSFYNISLLSRYISILPTMHLSAVIDPSEAISLRHPAEHEIAEQIAEQRKLYSRSAEHASAYQIPFSKLDPYSQNLMLHAKKLTQYPKSSKEFIITVALAIASALFIVYIVMTMYRCMCSRNYAKWRSSWRRRPKRRRSLYYVKQIRETVPLFLCGHEQEVECLASDGPLVISSCLAGQIRVWDNTSGECLTAVHRKSASLDLARYPCSGRNMDDSDADLYAEYHGNNDYYAEKTTPPSDNDDQTNNKNKMASGRKGHRRFESWPDLTPMIETNFTALARNRRDVSPPSSRCKSVPPGGDDRDSTDSFDFGAVRDYYREHRNSVEDRMIRRQHEELLRERSTMETGVGGGGGGQTNQPHSRSLSFGDQTSTIHYDATVHEQHFLGDQAPPIWCLTCKDNLIIAGCSNGRIEFWDALTGMLKCMYNSNTSGADGGVNVAGVNAGVTGICFISNRVIIARLNGTIDFLELETFCTTPIPGNNPTEKPSKLHNRGHFRAGSGHVRTGSGVFNWNDIIHCSLVVSIRAHQQPISVILSEGGRVVSASHDHTLKVYRFEDMLCLFTLHGHVGSVTALFLDKVAPLAAASGCEDGSVRLWDLLTGACVHKLDSHQGAVTAVTCTPMFVISSAQDDRLCIWERCRGTLLHSIRLDPGSCSSLAMLTSNLLVSSGQGCIMLWDITKGEFLRVVPLGSHDQSNFVRQLIVVDNSTAICDYGNELRVVHFPSVLEKVD